MRTTSREVAACAIDSSPRRRRAWSPRAGRAASSTRTGRPTPRDAPARGGRRAPARGWCPATCPRARRRGRPRPAAPAGARGWPARSAGSRRRAGGGSPPSPPPRPRTARAPPGSRARPRERVRRWSPARSVPHPGRHRHGPARDPPPHTRRTRPSRPRGARRRRRSGRAPPGRGRRRARARRRTRPCATSPRSPCRSLPRVRSPVRGRPSTSGLAGETWNTRCHDAETGINFLRLPWRAPHLAMTATEFETELDGPRADLVRP